MSQFIDVLRDYCDYDQLVEITTAQGHILTGQAQISEDGTSVLVCGPAVQKEVSDPAVFGGWRKVWRLSQKSRETFWRADAIVGIRSLEGPY